MTRNLFILLLIALVSSCSLFSYKTYTWDWRRDHLNYHVKAKQMILEEAPELIESVPRDIKNYCPDYQTRSPEARLEFWGLLLSSISWMESSHRTSHFYEEQGILDNSGQNVMSRGLLQFSFESAKSYYPDLCSAQELHRPETTLRIAAIVFKRFVIQDGVISAGKKGDWKGAARYWSVLRNNPKHTQIQEWLTNVDYLNPHNNIIPPPPHVTEDDYKPWIMKAFSKKETAESTLESH